MTGNTAMAPPAAQPAPPPPDRPWRMLIGGEHTGAGSGRYFGKESPADQNMIARVPDADPADVDRAVAAAAAAAPGWARVPARQRGAAVRAMAARLLEHAGELAVLDADRRRAAGHRDAHRRDLGRRADDVVR